MEFEVEGKRGEVVLGEEAYKEDCWMDQRFEVGGLVLNVEEVVEGGVEKKEETEGKVKAREVVDWIEK